MKGFDVYSYGVVSSSTLYRLQGSFPAAEGYAEISGADDMVGGEAANSSIVLARLGLRVKLDGSWLGNDGAGQRTKALLSRSGIDTSRLPLRDGHSGAREVVFAAGRTRTIFGSYCRLLETAAWNAPNHEDVAQASAICLDPFFEQASLRVAELGADAGIPVITVDCRHDDPVLHHTSAVVIADSYLRENYPDDRRTDLFRAYCRAARGLVIFTSGDGEIRYAERNGESRSFEPYAIEPVDTSGGGDSFRAGIVYGFVKGWSAGRMIAFAAALAAIVCGRSPGVLNAPDYEEVAAFLQAHPR